MTNVLVSCLSTGVRLESLDELIFNLKEIKVEGFSYELLILENNDEYSINIDKLVKIHEGTNLKVHRLLEVKRGIPYARNAALKFAFNEEYDYLAFIDDDAFPNKDWLFNLITTQKLKCCQVVTGPQLPIFETNDKQIFKYASIYSAREFPDNHKITWAATNNVLLDVNFFKRNNLTFNELLVEGGEDKELFLRASKAGANIYWNSKALVYEKVIKSRMTISWVLDRSFRHGATGFLIESGTKSSLKSYFVCTFKGCMYLLKSMLLLPVNFFHPQKSLLDSLSDFAHGLGFFYGLLTKGRFKKYI